MTNSTCLLKWESENLLPSDEQLAILLEIGGLPSSEFYIGPDSIEFPAYIITNEGNSIDLCVIHFSKSPPFQRHFKNIILLSDVKEILPSKLALSHDLRLSSILAEEIRMAFSPFMVQTKNGELLTYEGTTQFASTGTITGDEVLFEVPFLYKNFEKISNVSSENINYVIGKWNDDLEKLFTQYRSVLEKKISVRDLQNKTVPHKRSFWQRLICS